MRPGFGLAETFVRGFRGGLLTSPFGSIRAVEPGLNAKPDILISYHLWLCKAF